jgi:hypothetical protein
LSYSAIEQLDKRSLIGWKTAAVTMKFVTAGKVAGRQPKQAKLIIIKTIDFLNTFI